MKKKILVVDDSELEILYMENLIEKMEKTEKLSVDYASNADEALEKCRSEQYDLFLLDYFMPDGRADDLIKKIRTVSSKNADVPCVVMGKDSDFSAPEFLKENGFCNYIEKPAKYNMLKAAISLYTR